MTLHEEERTDGDPFGNLSGLACVTQQEFAALERKVAALQRTLAAVVKNHNELLAVVNGHVAGEQVLERADADRPRSDFYWQLKRALEGRAETEDEEE